MESTLNMVRRRTVNGSKSYIRLNFDSWVHKTIDVMDSLRDMGYTVYTGCMTPRHHAVITAGKEV